MRLVNSPGGGGLGGAGPAGLNMDLVRSLAAREAELQQAQGYLGMQVVQVSVRYIECGGGGVGAWGGAWACKLCR